MFAAFATADAVQLWALRAALETGDQVSPRDNPTFELAPAVFTLVNPLCRRIFNPSRKWSFALALGEFAWHVSGSDELQPLAFYAPQWADYSDDSVSIRGSCYGKRIFGGEGLSQWNAVAALLRQDPLTRRAVLTLQLPANGDVALTSVDVSCVNTLQFLIRGKKLHAICSMRSNDIIYGLPYDLFLFTMMQEMMAKVLGIDVGYYHHVAASLHLYERHKMWAEKILNERGFEAPSMPAMPGLAGLPQFLECEKAIRAGESCRNDLPAYWREFAEVIAGYAVKKQGGGNFACAPKI